MVRTEVDRCPGVLGVHEAADGGLARVRVPGGVLSPEQLDVLRLAAAELGDGRLELTSRGNVQIRGLGAQGPRELSERLYAIGLLPSITHERVRNIIASPLTGLDAHSRYDVLPVVADLDARLCARAELAELPGRFLFALDDGRGDVADLQADVAVQAVDDREGVLRLGALGVRVSWSEAAEVMVAAAEAFLRERTAQGSTAWRIAELADGASRVLDRLGLTAMERQLPEATTPQPGWAADGILVVAVPLGSLDQKQATALIDRARGIRVTPWRSVVLAGVAGDPTRELEAAGLVTTADSAWNGVTACAGQPGCAKARADVRADARRVTPRLPKHDRPVHWSGCERRCGKPAGEFVDVLALGNGYAIDGERMGMR